MRFTRILNHVEKHESFVYGAARFVEHEGETVLQLPMRPRTNARPICSLCVRTWDCNVARMVSKLRVASPPPAAHEDAATWCGSGVGDGTKVGIVIDPGGNHPGR